MCGEAWLLDLPILIIISDSDPDRSELVTELANVIAAKNRDSVSAHAPDPWLQNPALSITTVKYQ